MRTARLISLFCLSALFAACGDGDPVALDDGPVTGGLTAVVDVNNYRLTLRPELIDGGEYRGLRAVFGGGLVYGSGPGSVFFYNTRLGTSDFVGAGLPIEVFAPGTDADHQTLTLAIESPTDQPEPKVPLGLVVVRETFAFAAAPDDDYIIFKYTLFNPRGNLVSGLYLGQVLDLDLGPTVSDDIVRYDATNELAIVTSSEASVVLGHIMLSDAVTSYRPWRNESHEGPQPVDPMTNAEWFAFLSGGIVEPGPFGPTDVRHLLSRDTVSIAPGDSRVLAFALLGGADETDLATNVAQARARFSSIPTDPYPVSAVGVRIAPRELRISSEGIFVATFTFASAAQADLFDLNSVVCGGAPATALVNRSNGSVEVVFRLLDINPRVSVGEELFCAAELTDGTFHVGLDSATLVSTATSLEVPLPGEDS